MALDPNAGWVFVTDQLNIHCSEGLVRLAARKCGIPEDTLGQKGKSGVLESVAIRQAFLWEAFDVAPEGAQYVVGGGYRKAAASPSGWRNCNLRPQFGRIIQRAGLETWPRLFHNLRASRETELAQQ